MAKRPPPFYRVTVSGPVGTRPFRKQAADEFNELRLELDASNRVVADMLEADKGSVGRWATGTVDVPYWVILRLRSLVAS